MNIRERERISELLTELWHFRLITNRLNRRIKRDAGDLSEKFIEIGAALNCVTSSVSKVEVLIDRLLDEKDGVPCPPDYSSDETERLQHLNRILNSFSQFMYQTADEIRPSMEARLSNITDPMLDFEIEAQIDYQLRDDDSEYAEDSDNFLSSRSESLGHDRGTRKLMEDWRYSETPEPFKSEPLSWLLHSLTEHSYGANAPKVSLRDCLRIGTVYLDIQVWWQYAFDVDSGKWIKRWKQPECIPEYVENPLL